MPVVWTDRDGGAWILTGRVAARPLPHTVTLSTDGHHLQVSGAATDALEPGDLARVTARIDEAPLTVALPVEHAYPAYVARAVEVVRRPGRSPFSRDAETWRFEVEGLRRRLDLRRAVTDRLRGWLRDEGFAEVETPAIARSPGLDPHLSAFAALGESGRDPSEAPTPYGFLVTSPELHLKRLLVGGVSRCFELARCFRAGELGERHQPEFTMLEWYRAWAGLDDVLADTEALVREASAAGPTPGYLTVGERRVPVTDDFARLSVREAFARHAPELGDPVELAARDEPAYFAALSTRVEPELGWERPTFLTRFPAAHASLSRLHDDDPTVCQRGELYVGGVELCNAFDELTDPEEQRLRWAEQLERRGHLGLPRYPTDEAFLAALDEGMPPSGGNALGLDRLVALVGGLRDIADTQAFPRRPR